MHARHVMPFGAEVLGAEGVRFQLWAPAARRVHLVVEAAGLALPLVATGEGWHRLVTDQAPPGARYRYRIDDGSVVPDPASRFQPDDVHGPSEVVDPEAFVWEDTRWPGRPWEMVFYELHVGPSARRAFPPGPARSTTSWISASPR
jgi:1,4-alpha-glucan branching enzyme